MSRIQKRIQKHRMWSSSVDNQINYSGPPFTLTPATGSTRLPERCDQQLRINNKPARCAQAWCFPVLSYPQHPPHTPPPAPGPFRDFAPSLATPFISFFCHLHHQGPGNFYLGNSFYLWQLLLHSSVSDSLWPFFTQSGSTHTARTLNP